MDIQFERYDFREGEKIDGQFVELLINKFSAQSGAYEAERNDSFDVKEDGGYLVLDNGEINEKTTIKGNINDPDYPVLCFTFIYSIDLDISAEPIDVFQGKIIFGKDEDGDIAGIGVEAR